MLPTMRSATPNERAACMERHKKDIDATQTAVAAGKLTHEQADTLNSATEMLCGLTAEDKGESKRSAPTTDQSAI